jgi:hypothetical protein
MEGRNSTNIYNGMVTNIDFDSTEWRVLVRKLYAFAAVHFNRLYKRETNERAKSIHDYVSEAIEKHLSGEDNYDPTKSPLEYHLKYNVIRRSIYNDLPPQAKRERIQASQESIVESNLVPVAAKPMEPSVAPMGLGTYDTELLFKEIGKRANGDHVVEQLALAIWVGGFELSNRAAICKEYDLTQADFDKGKKRFMTVLGHVFKSLNWKIEEYEHRQR